MEAADHVASASMPNYHPGLSSCHGRSVAHGLLSFQFSSYGFCVQLWADGLEGRACPELFKRAVCGREFERLL